MRRINDRVVHEREMVADVLRDMERDEGSLGHLLRYYDHRARFTGETKEERESADDKRDGLWKVALAHRRLIEEITGLFPEFSFDRGEAARE